MILRFAMAFIVLAPSGASADMAAASACAASLSDDGKAIFRAAAPGIKSAGDKYQFVKGKALALVAKGEISPFSAKANAEAAGECLKMMR
ncbi:hypothetical protein [Rhodoblastus sp.]|uniref:hypothetical protein n=1 Tax=Rhodoblastus sp. TaxID=1962975 RepID=UPI0035B48613